MAVNPELARVTVPAPGLDHGGKASALSCSRRRVSNETPVSAVNHSYYRNQVGRLLLYAVR